MTANADCLSSDAYIYEGINIESVKKFFIKKLDLNIVSVY